MKKGDHLFLVDGSSYIFRAYHALPPLTRKSDDLPVGAVSGFCGMLWKLLQEARDTSVGVTPTHFAVIFDYSSKTFRNQIYKEYKANRPPPPEDLRPQFGLIRQATEAFGVPSIEIEGYEADDIIATYTKQATKAGGDVTIISSDKDLMQLVNPNVVMYDTMKDKRVDQNGVVEKFGVTPEKMIDLQSLAGDSSDNIPGVPGIGPKTAAQLLDEYGTLEKLLERAGEIKQQKKRENLIEFAEQARISKQLVTLKDDTPVEIPLDGLVMEPVNGPQLIAFLKGMEFVSLTRRVAKETDSDAAEIEPLDIVVDYDNTRGPDSDVSEDKQKNQKNQKIQKNQKTETKKESSGGKPKKQRHEDGEAWTPQDNVREVAEKVNGVGFNHKEYVTVRTVEELNEWIVEATTAKVVAVDTETTSLDAMQAELVGVSLATEPGRACYIPLNHVTGEGGLLGNEKVEGQMETKVALKMLKPLLENSAVLKIAQNMKYDWLILYRHDINMYPFDDTMLLSYVLDAGRTRHNMDALSQSILGHEPIAYKDVVGSGKTLVSFAEVDVGRATEYAAEDADVTLRLWHILKARLTAEGMNSVYERLEKPLVDVVSKMEQRGVCVDEKILKKISRELAQKAASFETEIHKMAGETFNVGSPKQLGEILFEKMNLPGGKKTQKSGQYATGVQVLEDLAAEGHELPKKIVEWRQVTKLKSTYTDALPDFINPNTNRIHTSYAMASTSTGRFSSSDPNLQNIPIRTNEGRKIRTAFVAPKGFKLLSADYSQIELRVLAHVSDIQQLKKAFEDGLDIHAMTASEMFDVPIKDMDPMIRRQAKAINFGIIYGISAFGLAANLGISRTEAADYIKMYFERFPGIRDYMETTKEFAREHGYVQTVFGRKAHYPDIKASNPQMRAFNERAAINAPIQGSAADIIRRAMVKMEPALEAKKVEAKMLLQVHDELIFEVPDKEVKSATEVVTEVMQDATLPAMSLSVPLKVDARAAQNWDEAH